VPPSFPLTTENSIWLLGSICQIHRIPFDPVLVLQQCPPPHSTGSLLDACAALRFKTGFRRVADGEWAKAPKPCIAFLKPEPGGPPESPVDGPTDAPVGSSVGGNADEEPEKQTLEGLLPEPLVHGRK
jgi:ATP-binding cassette, subfamily B, bacterial HlyB/CyaB